MERNTSRSARFWAVVPLLCAVALVVARPALSGEDSPFKPFGEITKNAEHQSGFFDVFQKRGKVYVEIPVEKLGQPMLLVPSISRGIGSHGLLGGMPTSIFDGLLVQFERRHDKVQLIQLNHRFRAPEGTPEARAVALSFGNSILAALEITSERHEGDEIGKVDKKKDDEEKDDEKKDDDEKDDDEEKEDDESEDKPVVSVLVDLTPFLLSDLANVAQGINEGSWFYEKIDSNYGLNPERSSVRSAKVFPENAEFDMDLTFVTGKDPFLDSVIDSRFMTIGVHHSFSALPKEPMRPRYADPRTGFFTTVYKDFSLDHEKEFFVRYVNRWRLEKEDAGAELSKPKKQIVYYVENTIPEEYRKYVKQGIEMWQKAFEAAGFKEAIVARDQPNDPDWSAEDARYSTIRWITSHDPSFGAIGPSRTDPRTGEILDADILVEANMIQGFRNQWQRMVASPGRGTGVDADPFETLINGDRLAYEQAYRQGGAAVANRMCAAGQSLVLSGGFANMALAARGDIQPGEPVPEEYLGQAIAWVIAHEVGHTLGMEHNFKSSMCVPYDQLNDKAFTGANGLYGSVMEYPQVNVAPTKEGQGYYYTPVVGTYDDWTIRYGYAEFKDVKSPDDEKDELAVIAAESAQPRNFYGSSENYYPIGAVDAYTNAYDLGNDPLRFAKDRTAHITSLFIGLEDRLVTPGKSWDNLTNGFSILLANYYQSMNFVARYVGGMETSRAYRGEPGAQDPMKVIPAAKQREAVEFLAEHLFTEEPFRVPAGFMEKLEPNRWSHWGMEYLPAGREDFPYQRRILTMQRAVVDRLMHPITLQRVLDSEGYQANPLTLVELFDTMGDAVWSEALVAPAETARRSAVNRSAQRLWLDKLIEVAFTPLPNTPDDARAVARMNLVELDERIGSTLAGAGNVDGYTKAHLLDCKARIETALRAGYELEIMGKKS